MTRVSPLAHLPRGNAGTLELPERAFVGMLNLRGDAGEPAFVAAVARTLGAEPPVVPNTVARAGEIALCWLGPDEWLVTMPESQFAARRDTLHGALAGQHAAVTEVGDGHTTLVLDHPQAAALLSRGCPLDFDEAAFPVGTCAQSVFNRCGLLLLREAPQGFALVVRRSFAPYLYLALQDAAARAG